MRSIDVVGKVYGRLTVVADAPSRMSAGRPIRFVGVVCQCGTHKEINLTQLTTGRTTSCGCFRKETTSDMARSHGQSGTKLYKVWKGMQSRCYIPSASNFEYYGGRGIKVCDEWHAFEPFKAWADANGYQEDLEIDRENNDGDYTPTNCRWITHQAQCNNRRPRSK